jgi:hypothetical protein
MKQLKGTLLFVGLLSLFYSCHKENGKHKYLLTLDFDNYSDNATFEYYVFEKVKNYKQSWAPKKSDLYYDKGGMVLANEDQIRLSFSLYEGNVKRGLWSGSNYFEFDDHTFPINSIQPNSSNKFKGTLGINLEYIKKGKEIIVYPDYSSFTFIWQNHAEFGHADSIFYGQCSLRRVK